MTNELDASVAPLIQLIRQTRDAAYRKVNEELIRLYWLVGEYLSRESRNVNFGDSCVDSVAKNIQDAFPGVKVLIGGDCIG